MPDGRWVATHEDITVHQRAEEMLREQKLQLDTALNNIQVMLGFLFQWPTLLTLLMFPILVWMYSRLARGEEREVARRFGDAYAHYAATTPRFVPWRGNRLPASGPGPGVAAAR